MILIEGIIMAICIQKTIEELLKVNAVDLTLRCIRKAETLEVYCHYCKINKRTTTWQIANQNYKVHGHSYICPECSSKKMSAQRTGRKNVHKVSNHSQEYLEQLNLVDTTPRNIQSPDKVEVKCNKHPEKTSFQAFNNLTVRFKNFGFSWQCRDCFREGQSIAASKKTGEKNGFYGKKHKKETRDIISKVQTEISLSKPLEERLQLGKKLTQAALDIYGCNPMFIDWVKKKQWDSTHTPEFIEEATLRQIKRCADPDYLFMISQKSIEWWATPEGQLTREALKIFVTVQWNTPVGEFYEKREENLKSAILLMKKQDMFNFANKPGQKGRKTSTEELEVASFLSKFIDSEMESIILKKAVKGWSEIDIYFALFKIGIEYCGLHYHSERTIDSNSHHLEKLLLAEENGIRLIQIFSYEWKKRKFQVLSFLQALFGKYDVSVGARQCELCEITVKEAGAFLDQYHIQGKGSNSIYALALKKDNEILQVVTFSKHHRNNTDIVLNRMTSKKGVHIAGGFARLSHHASIHFKQDIISWVDRRWSQGEGYLRAGWLKDGVLPPDYFYTAGNETVISKQSRKKSNVNTPDYMTEHEHALLDGLYRVWDCGKFRFIYPYVK